MDKKNMNNNYELILKKYNNNDDEFLLLLIKYFNGINNRDGCVDINYIKNILLYLKNGE
jgi:hypothetical protein|tara:strand:+ start:468 stop:644 length:177 start_codon:yes stop_codon:yes gene_type:complete